MDTETSAFACEVTDEDVFLTVKIGQGQLGATEVFRRNDMLVKGGVVISRFNLGPGFSLAGDSISVESLVNDVGGQTNKMSVTYLIENGAKTTKFVARHTVAHDADMCSFVSAITFARKA